MPVELMGMLILAAVVGLCIGRFLNVVIHRLPRMLEQGWRTQCAELSGETAQPPARYNLLVPRSQCPACGHRIGALDNIPVASASASHVSAPRTAVPRLRPPDRRSREHPRLELPVSARSLPRLQSADP